MEKFNIEIKKNEEDLIIADVTGNRFSDCYFVFYKNNISCFGDIDSFTWDCTWDTVKSIRNGDMFAHNEYYIFDKLAHRHEFKKFSREKFDECIENAKNEYLEELDEEQEKNDFLKRWEKNEYLLEDVDGYRLNGFEEFCYNMNIDLSDLYEWFFVVDKPYYDIAVKMLQEIEEYFKEKSNYEG